MSDKQIHFTTRVLGPVTTFRLEQCQVTQTLRAESDSVTNAILNGQASAGDKLEITLDTITVGMAELISMDAVIWGSLDIGDAHRGGFDNLDDLSEALKRAGYRFKPLNDYHLFRIQFSWLEEVYA